MGAERKNREWKLEINNFFLVSLVLFQPFYVGESEWRKRVESAKNCEKGVALL